MDNAELTAALMPGATALRRDLYPLQRHRALAARRGHVHDARLSAAVVLGFQAAQGDEHDGSAHGSKRVALTRLVTIPIAIMSSSLNALCLARVE